MAEKSTSNSNLTNIFSELMQQLNTNNSLEWLQLDLTFQQMKVLYLLRRHGSQKMSDLHKELDVTMPTITGIVNRLIERRDGAPLVARETSPDDRREVRARLTPQGYQVTEMLNKLNNKLLEGALAQLSGDELQSLENTLTRLLGVLNTQRQQDETQNAASSNGHKGRKRAAQLVEAVIA
jgi:DNA-binding MarR family transcriptional regulator